jgi:hypothetical protein
MIKSPKYIQINDIFIWNPNYTREYFQLYPEGRPDIDIEYINTNTTVSVLHAQSIIDTDDYENSEYIWRSYLTSQFINWPSTWKTLLNNNLYCDICKRCNRLIKSIKKNGCPRCLGYGLKILIDLNWEKNFLICYINLLPELNSIISSTFANILIH